jgi:hypothetical protein
MEKKNRMLIISDLFALATRAAYLGNYQTACCCPVCSAMSFGRENATRDAMLDVRCKRSKHQGLQYLPNMYDIIIYYNNLLFLLKLL